MSRTIPAPQRNRPGVSRARVRRSPEVVRVRPRPKTSRTLDGTLVGGWGISAFVHIAFFVVLGLVLIPLASSGSGRLMMQAVFEDRADQVLVRLPNAPSVAALPDDSASRGGRPVTRRGGLDLPSLSVSLDESLGHPAPGEGTGGGGDTGTGQATFFGSTAYGSQFVFVLDVSSSMTMASFETGLRREQRARRELIRSIEQLTDQQSFYVFLFSSDTQYMFGREVAFPQPIRATDENKQQVRAWLEQVRIGGITDPRKALRTAMRMEPHAVFLLSDGEFNKNGGRSRLSDTEVLELLDPGTGTPVPVHTVAFEDPVNERVLSRIAHATNGTHRFVGLPDSDHGRADAFLLLAGRMDPRREPEVIDLYYRVVEEHPGTDQAAEAAARLETILSPPDDSGIKAAVVARYLLVFAERREEEGQLEYALERYRMLAERFPRAVAGRTAASRLRARENE